jgi:hypothetical protein
MDTSTSLVFGVLYGAIGMGYVVYGKRQKKGVALLAGIALCVSPYICPNAILLLLLGIVLMALPFFARY